MRNCEADAETGLYEQDTCCLSMTEMGIELGRLGDCQPAMQEEGRERGGEGDRLGRRVRLHCNSNNPWPKVAHHRSSMSSPNGPALVSLQALSLARTGRPFGSVALV